MASEDKIYCPYIEGDEVSENILETFRIVLSQQLERARRDPAFAEKFIAAVSKPK